MGTIPLSESEFKNEVTATIKSCHIGGQMHSQTDKLMTNHDGCKWEGGWSCGKPSGCTDEVKDFIVWALERDDNRTSWESETWDQFDPVDNKTGSKFHQQVKNVRAALEEEGKSLTDPGDFSLLVDQRAIFDVIPDRRDPEGRRPWLRFKALEG